MSENKGKPLVVIKTYNNLFEVVIYEFCSRFEFEKDNIEQIIQTVSMGCNYAGITENEAIRLIVDRYSEKLNIDKTYVVPIVEKIYKEYIAEHGSKSMMFSLKVRNKFDDKDWMGLPYIPDELYEKLPVSLKKATARFENKRERDVFLTGAIGVISGILTNVYGIYQGSIVYPNLYVFVVAPAGSGKGSLIHAKKMFQALHNSTNDIDKNVLMFIPANISSASINEQLNKNNGWGIVFETEADTMANAFSKEWGTYSDILRNAFHHEPIESKRKDNDLYLNVPNPKLSVILSGTPNQIRGIVKNTEDGLFSRFTFYTFRAEVNWKEFSYIEISNDEFFKQIGNELTELVGVIIGNVEFRLTDKQMQVFNRRFDKWLKDFVLYMNDEAVSIIKRHGLMFFRIAMIMTVLKKAENPPLPTSDVEPLYCDNEDFQTAFMLIETYIHHAYFVFRMMHKNVEQAINIRLQMFYDNLPESFNRTEAVKQGQIVGIASRTVDKYLHDLVKSGYLIKDTSYGNYKKA